MKISTLVSLKNILIGMSAAVLGLSLIGCASTSEIKLDQAGPIAYKIGDGAAQYASQSTPPPLPAPHPLAIVQQGFDQTRVDRDLYKHQRVGNSYTILGKSYTPKHQPDYDVTGVASWYGDKFHGKPTATGEIYDMNDLTAAHRTLPLNSMLFVTNVENGKTLVVRLNDRGPFTGDRFIDLSKASADALGIEGRGQVRVQYAGPADPMAARR